MYFPPSQNQRQLRLLLALSSFLPFSSLPRSSPGLRALTLIPDFRFPLPDSGRHRNQPTIKLISAHKNPIGRQVTAVDSVGAPAIACLLSAVVDGGRDCPPGSPGKEPASSRSNHR
ncbi:hypothetical protein PLICRDRAFT_581627 [Plicaturopsis crispa FD-325 SS-3]|nr:hypothetical protein PLICRDRAFT_581627 [Plicaturopsis crispa FD-325 SS-3]